jgi:hypothetical protein
MLTEQEIAWAAGGVQVDKKRLALGHPAHSFTHLPVHDRYPTVRFVTRVPRKPETLEQRRARVAQGLPRKHYESDLEYVAAHYVSNFEPFLRAFAKKPVPAG